MLAATPPMGWNSWNTFGPGIDQDLIVETADAMVSTGLRDAGYRYVVVDDVWMAEERKDGKLTHDPDRFSMGMAALADELHRRDLLFGIYSCAGTHTCEGLPASYGYEDVDAATFAEWGVDFLKYDFCYTSSGSDPVAMYRRMGQALRSTGRDIVYSVCEWGVNRPWEWGASIGANMWRTTEDIVDTWDSVARIGFQLQVDLHAYAGPGRWNDPDMLVVGMRGRGHVGRDGLTDAEYRSHFALWCMLAAPLMIGCDVRSIDEASLRLLSDPTLIGIDQDVLGRQAHRVSTPNHGFGEAWAKPLRGGAWAVALFNTSERDEVLVTVGWEQLGLARDTPMRVHDVMTGHIEHGVTRSWGARIGRHDVRVGLVHPT